MPLLYGEGDAKAFYRLQLEVIAQSDDESIFAWADGDTTILRPLLARSPDAFHGSAQFESVSSGMFPIDPDRPPYAMTNKSLRIEPLLTNYRFEEDTVRGSLENLNLASVKADTFLMPLNCRVERTHDCICILMRRLSANAYCRLGPVLCRCTTALMRQRCLSSERKAIFVEQF